MRLKYSFLATLLASSTVSLDVMADDSEFSSSVTLVSQYLFRGFDLSSEDPTIQGDVVYSAGNGFSIGLWGSGYDVGIDDGFEVDIFASYEHEISDSVSVNVGFTEYTYSGDIDSSTEIYVGVNFSDFSFTYYDDTDLDTSYIDLGYDYAISEEGELSFHVGKMDPDGGEDSTDFSIAYSHTFSDMISATFMYSSNDLDVPGAEDYFVVSLTASF